MGYVERIDYPQPGSMPFSRLYSVLQIPETRLTRSISKWHTTEVHIGRYEFASTVLAGGLVLDVACGVGYGKDYLDASVIGVDISNHALQIAKNHGAQVGQADARKLPFPDRAFDGVVSFETIEHMPQADAMVFLSELKRCLKKNRSLIISAPNRLFDSPESTIKSIPPNKYHFYEPTLNEFRIMVEGAGFQIERMLYQTGRLGIVDSSKFVRLPLMLLGRYSKVRDVKDMKSFDIPDSMIFVCK